ncbi:ankyrin repeat-containing protein At5g02620-like [Fagus crenata]
MVEKILENIPSALIKQADDQGSTSLHYAASLDRSYIIKLLLKNDRALAYMKDKKGRTALHIAAYERSALKMKEILSSCPDCCEIVDESGWNALHVVVNSPRDDWDNRALRVILDRSSFNHLLNEKDVDGSTPLHHHSKSSQYLKDLMCHDRVDKMAFNKENLDAYDIALTNSKLSDQKGQQELYCSPSLAKNDFL